MPDYRLTIETHSPIATPLGATDTIVLDAFTKKNIEPRHTDAGLWSVSTTGVPDDRAAAVEAFAAVKATTTIEARGGPDEPFERILTPGPLENVDYDPDSGRLELEGRDAGATLEASANGRAISTTFADDAISAYWADIEGFDAQVDPDTDTVVIEGEQLQQASSGEFEALFGESIEAALSGREADETPLTVDPDPELLPVGFPLEAEDGYDGDTTTDSAFSGGEAALFEDSFAPEVSRSFVTEHAIPQSDLVLGVRSRNDSSIRVDVRLDGETIIADDPLSSALQWDQFTQDSLFDAVVDSDGRLPAGTHTIEVEPVAESIDSGETGFECDLAALVDDGAGFDITFDNETDSNEALDGPQRYPASLTLESESADAGNLIASATVALSIDATDNDQAIGISFDGGDSYETASNTDTATADRPDELATSTVETRLTLSRSEPNGPQAQTPKFGYETQTITEYELTADLSNRAVIERDRFEDDDLTNLKELHSRADYRFVFIPDANSDAVQVRSFPRGEWVIEDVSFKELSRNRRITAEEYYNSVTVKGPRPDDGGDRPEVTRKDNSEIDRVGAELRKTTIRNDLETDADRATAAQSLLEELTANADAAAAIEAAPTVVLPGPEYDIGLDDPVPLESVRYSDRFGGGNVSLEFDRRPGLGDVVGSTRGDLRHEKRR